MEWQYEFEEERVLMLRIAHKIVGNSEDAHDVVQDAFVKAYRNMKSFDPTKSSFRTWMMRHVKSASIDFLRRKASTKRTAAGSPSRLEFESMSFTKNHVWLEEFAKQEKEHFQVLVLKYVERMTTEEVRAFYNDRTTEVTKTRIKRAKEAARAHFMTVCKCRKRTR